jgi:type IV pilus assembly protein PilC
MKLSKKEISYFSRQMSTLLNAGIPLLTALDIVKNATENHTLKKLMGDLKSSLESGNSFSKALAEHPHYFDILYTSLIHTGEVSGKLSNLLTKIASYQERRQQLNKKIKKALLYPIVVTIIGILITFILLVFIVPQFEKLYANFAVSLPLFTQAVLNLAQFLQQYGLLALLALITLCCLSAFSQRHFPVFIRWRAKMLLNIPLFGPLLKKAIYARFASTFATTFQAGVPLMSCLDLVAKACANPHYHDAVLDIKQQVMKGTSLNQAMRHASLFPNLLTQMVAVGENAGSLDTLLEKTAEFYETDIEIAIDALSQLLEPLMMTMLGILVGGLVIAMYLPLFKLGTII